MFLLAPSKIFFVIASSLIVSASRVVLKDNGYEGVVIALENDLPIDYCQEIILGLESLIHASSTVVFATSRGRASFKEVNVLIPTTWTPSACPILQGQLRSAAGESFNVADVRITKSRHPNFGARPWALQSKGCAQQGDYISIGHEILFQNETEVNGRRLAHSWLKYRYGVFDEVGVEGSTTHPTTHRNLKGEWVASACSNSPLHQDYECAITDVTCAEVISAPEGQNDIRGSFMAFPEVDSVTELCDEGTHDPTAPTPHNLICGAKSVWEVLRASPDFQKNQNVESLSRPGDIKFNYVRSKPPRMILLVEDTNIMNGQKRWDFMRKAVRKLVIYDVPDGFSVGLVVFDLVASTKYPLKPLNDDGTRYNLGSSLPRNPSGIDKHRRCVICGLEESVRLLRETGGTDGGHIVLMLAGSGHIDQKDLEKAEKLLSNTNIILHVIVYPLTEKFPEPGGGIEVLGSRTGGLTFTIPDEGIGADSKIVMYYNLLDSLYHTLSAAAGDNVLPVKVHSAEHEGGLIQNSEGSFWVDPGLGSDTVFAVFYYDLAHVGDAIHLISPHGQVIDTGNMQSEDDNMNMITIRLRKNQEAQGLWHYSLENRADSHQALFVQVTSKPQSVPDATRINVRTWTNHKEGQVNLTDIANPLIIFAEVRVGLSPVEEAKLTAVLTRLGVTSNGTEHKPIRISLHDNGLLSPDIQRGDGVYSRLVTELGVGKYSAVVFVEGHIGEHKFTRHLRLGILDVVGVGHEEDAIPPSRITNLRVAILPATDGQVSFAWTAPGNDYDYGRAKNYKVLVKRDLRGLMDETGDILEGWPEPLPALSIQQHTITWREYDQVYYLGMYAVDSSGNAAILSNIVEIYVPAPSTTAPSTVVTVPSFSKSKEEINASDSSVLSGFDTRQLAVVFGCLGGFLLVVFLVVGYCTSAHRKGKKSRSEKCQEQKDGFNVTVTVGSKGSDFTQEKHSATDGLKKDYLRPINSWSPSELLGTHPDKRGSISGRSDNNSDHSGSTKKSYGGSSDPPQYYGNGGGQYSYEGNSYGETYPIPNDGYPTPVEGYPQPSNNYPTASEGYVIDGFPVPSEIRSYVSSQPSDSFLSESCDMLPGSQGPPGYSAYPPYDNALRGSKVPPPIPPKPKVQYTPEPYIYEGQDINGRNSSNASVTSEKRVRNVTMV